MTTIKNKGFTLIELLVVIAIIAFLTQIVIGNMNDARKKSRDAKRVSDIAQLQLALELFFDKCNGYPQTAATGNPLKTTSTNPNCTTITLGTFIPAIPTPPTGSVAPNGSAELYYKYVGLRTGCVDYHLGATLETNNQGGPLKDDVDAVASNTATSCRSGTEDFSGVDDSNPNNKSIYDVKP